MIKEGNSLKINLEEPLRDVKQEQKQKNRKKTREKLQDNHLCLKKKVKITKEKHQMELQHQKKSLFCKKFSRIGT